MDTCPRCSESSLETSNKPHLRRVITNFIFQDILEAELFLSPSRPTTFSIVLNDGVNKDLMVSL